MLQDYATTSAKGIPAATLGKSKKDLSILAKRGNKYPDQATVARPHAGSLRDDGFGAPPNGDSAAEISI